jgi:hypothetical protein
MRTIFSTADVPRADAFAYWHDIACARIIAHESELVDPDNFYAELKAASLADLSLLVWTVAPVRATTNFPTVHFQSTAVSCACSMPASRLLFAQWSQ